MKRFDVRRRTEMIEGGLNSFCLRFRGLKRRGDRTAYSHAHGLLQALDVLAVTVNAEAEVGGGAGILGGAESRRVPAGVERVHGAERCRAFALLLVPLLASAFPFLLLILAGMRLCGRRSVR